MKRPLSQLSESSIEIDALKKKGIRADNSHFSQYEGVAKPTYHLTETGDDADAIDDNFQFQTVDISSVIQKPDDKDAQLKVGKELVNALCGIGFVIITGHGVDTNLYEEAHARTEKFFTENDDSVKQKFLAKRKGSVNQGYFPIGETSNLHPDQVEGWVFCRRAFDIDKNINYDYSQFWPTSDDEKWWRKIILAHEKLVLPITHCILGGLEIDHGILDKHLIGNNFGFRLNYYPAISKEATEQKCGRMLGHEDVDLFTILPASPIEGLQVLNRETGKWVRMNAPAGSIILNVGDYFQRITNDILPSTTHRVAAPRDPKMRGKTRTSFPMAIYLNEDVVLQCLPGCGKPKYPPITALDFHTGITSKYYGKNYKKTGSD